MVIPEGVQTIGDSWFWNSGVERVEISASVKEIGTDAFCHCENLKCVVFAPGSSLKKIGARSFCETKIERITIPKCVEEVPKRTFENCKHLLEVAFEEGSQLKIIGTHAFNSCGNLTKINLPAELTHIEACAF